MYTTFRIPLDQRAVLVRDGQPVRALAPGKHTVWGRGYDVVRYDVNALLLDAPAAIRAVLPAGWIEEIRLATRQRAVIQRDGRPVKWLRPGVHRVWTVDPSVELRVLSLDDAPPEMTDELRAVVPATELVEITVQQHQRGLKYVQGRFDALLPAGRYLFWSTPEARVSVSLIDVRQQQVTVAGQDLLTRDKVTLRLTLTAEYAPADVPVVVHTVADIPAALYLAIQLAARDYVAGVTLDELLEGRDAMSRFLLQEVGAYAQGLGLDVRRVGVKDVVLPGDMKTLLNRVIEAEKEAAANVIRRREESAAMRNMANTARTIAENPVLMRLKELETLEAVAAKVGEVRVLVAPDGLRAMIGERALVQDTKA